MHAQTISTTTNTEVTSARALATMLLATDRTKEERRKLDDLFPQAKQAETHLAWKGIAKGVKKLHDQISFSYGKVGDDQGVVGDAYRKASRASHRDSGASAQLAAHVAIETIAKSFTTDGTYANYAVNPDGIQHIAALVGELQHQSRDLNRDLGLGGLAIDQVFFKKDDRSAWNAAVANRAHQRKIDEDGDGSEEWSAAEREFYTTPAPDFAAVLQKLGDNIQAEDPDCGNVDNTETVDQTVARLKRSHDLNETCLAHVYLDIQRLAETTPPVAGALTDPAADFDLLSAIDEHKLLRDLQKAAIKADDVEKAEQHTEAMQPILDRASELRAKTLAGLMGRAWLIEDWAPAAGSLDGQDLEWKIVHSLLDDIKALYAAQEPRALVGSKAVTAGWIAVGLAQRCGVFSASTDPVAIAAE